MNNISFYKYFCMGLVLSCCIFFSSCATTTPQNDKKWKIENVKTNEENDSSEYYIATTELMGVICPYCIIKNDKAFDKIFPSFVMDSFGLNKYELPEFAKVKNNFVSVKYIKEKYPSLYTDIVGSDEIAQKSKDNMSENEYSVRCIFGSNSSTGNIITFYKHNDKLYLNYLFFANNGATWFYTRELLEIMLAGQNN